MQMIHTEIQIKASPENIWNALMASPSIPEEIRNAIRERKTGVNMKVAMSAGRQECDPDCETSYRQSIQ